MYDSINKNNLARDGGAVGAGIPRDSRKGNPPNKATVKILAYKEMNQSSSTAKPTSLEQRDPSSSSGGFFELCPMLAIARN